MKIKVAIDPDCYIPERVYGSDAGWDLKTPYDVVAAPLSAMNGAGRTLINTGVHMAIPEGFCGLIVAKSGLNVKNDITATGLIDSGYSGAIHVKLYNHGNREYRFRRGEKIAQIVILPIAVVDALVPVDSIEGGDRGDNGFGSTGK